MGVGKAVVSFLVLAGASVAGLGCSSSGRTASGGAGTLYSATCEQACDKTIACGDTTSTRDACVTDCRTEPWAGNYRQCKAGTCGLTDAQCEKFGVKTCVDACQKKVSCGSVPQSGYDQCVADCKTEPWPGNYIDCEATVCGATDAQCESFTGN